IMAKPIIVKPETSYTNGLMPSFFFREALAFFLFFDFLDMFLLLSQKGFPAVRSAWKSSVVIVVSVELVFHDDWNDHWSSFCLLEQIRTQRITDLLLYVCPFECIFIHIFFDNLMDKFFGLI